MIKIENEYSGGPVRRFVCLVTGGAGFMGRHVAHHLLEKQYEVVIVDDLSGGMVENLPPGATFVQGSVTDAPFVNSLFDRWRFDLVFHLAAYAAENLSHFIKRFNYEVNLLGSINLINASINHPVRCFIFTSSIAVYGDQPSPLKEETPPAPADSYGIAKWTVEQELAISHEMFGLNYLVFRPHNVYGEFQNLNDKYRNVLGIFMSQILRGETLTIFGDGQQTRAFSHIDDVVPLMIQAAENEKTYNHVFNVGSDVFTTVNELATLVQRVFGKKSEIIHLPARHEVKHAYSSHEKARKILGYSPRIDLENGIARMATWAKTAPVREPSEFAQVEVWKNMPSHWMPRKSSPQ